MTTQHREPCRRVNVLVAQDVISDCRLAQQIVGHLGGRHSIRTRTLTYSCNAFGETWVVQDGKTPKRSHMTSDQLVDWADLLVVACLGAGSLSKMLQGDTEGFLLEVLRSWDVSKKILLVPGMTIAMWENPMTKKQMNKIRRKWNWIRVLEPVLWQGKDLSNAFQDWPAMDELIQGIYNQADLLSLGHDMDTTPANFQKLALNSKSNQVDLPSEIWSLVMEYVGDWEVAKALGIYTNLSTPEEWTGHQASAPQSAIDLQRTSDLESLILLGSYSQTINWFKHYPTPKWLSKLCVKLILKFARTDLLSYLESHHKELFWSTFGHTLLPTKASAVFGKIAILDWWYTSPSFLSKEYNAEALDSASKAGFVHILEWWRESGLPLRYTEAALEQASSRGNLEVLEWWRSASLPQSYQGKDIEQSNPTSPTGAGNENDVPTNASNAGPINKQPLPLRLKVGKSLIYAAQNGQAATLDWWVKSGVPTAHEEAVARIASANGHVDVLQLWKECKGEKLQYDHQVLVGPTKNGHVEVLEWWKQSMYTVEYKTCDIEEALEDCLGGSGEDRIRAWWARNGLNLGVGTREWMTVKIL